MSVTALKMIKALKWGGTGLLAGLFTLGLHHWSVQLTESTQFENALRWSTQITSQAEGLFLAARQRGERDPVGIVVSALSQGSEPRVMRVTRFNPSMGPVGFHSLPEKKIFEYAKMLTSDEQNGIRIEIEARPARYLGARTSLQNDLLVLFTFLLNFIFLHFTVSATLPGKWSIRGEPIDDAEEIAVAVLQLHPQSPAAQTQSQPDSDFVREWIREATVLLSGLGARVRDLISEARNLTVSASKSRSTVDDLRGRIHGQLNQIRESRASVKLSEQLALQSETLTLNLVIEAARLGPDAQKLGRMCEELHLLIKKLRIQNLGNDTLIRKSEVDFEPLATDADVAFHAYEEIFQAAGKMDEHIRKTTETLLRHAKLNQKLNQSLPALPASAEKATTPPPFRKDRAS
ncbi:MAG: hypothetical protein H7222_10545 [Methylotenera sp.]|nr:hypothetical protein [Oligoflexia bacterium]